ncbi:MAG: hypothetical protein ACOX8X_02595 [Methanomethylophilus sp.]
MFGMTRKSRRIKRRSLGRDRSGGIEGLPLELMIILVVAALGTAVLVGWFGNLDDPEDMAPKTIGDVEINPQQLYGEDAGYGNSVTVTVLDGDGSPIEGAHVLIDGCNGYCLAEDGESRLLPQGSTDGNGVCQIDDVLFDLDGETYGYTTVRISAPDYGSKDVTVMVTRLSA